MAAPKVLAVARGTLDETLYAETPAGHPNVWVVVMPAAQMILIRTARTYLQALLGFLGAATLGVLPTDPTDPQSAGPKIVMAAGLALFPAFVSLVQNLLEILTKLDTKLPELRG